MTGHLTDADVRAFASGDLAPDRLLEADDHLASCPACRERAATLLAAGRHVDAFSVAARGDLRTADRRAHRSRAWWWAAAAVVALAIAPLMWRLAVAPVDPLAGVAGVDTLSVDERRRVASALARGRAEIAPLVTHLAGRRETLMGDDTPPAFAVTSPLASATIEDRPLFTWMPLADAVSYEVVVVDDGGEAVARSGPRRETQWRPDAPLRRGSSYTWQVSAQVGGRVIAAPAAPSPPARFHVLSAETAGRLAKLAATTPDAHLALGILLAEHGVADAAEHQLRQVDVPEPQAAVARRTLEALNRSREPQP
jgi:hypothetical protein